MAENIEVRWSNEAKADLKRIFEIILDHTSSELSARNVIKDILQKTKNLAFTEQYQIDEYLGMPYRRMIVRHYKIIYKVQSKSEIRILQIFDSRQSPNKHRKQ